MKTIEIKTISNARTMATSVSLILMFLFSFFLARGAAIYISKKASANEWVGELSAPVFNDKTAKETPFIISKTLRTYTEAKNHCLNEHNGEMLSVEALAEIGDFSPFLNLVVWTDSVEEQQKADLARVVFFYNKSNLIQFTQKSEMKHGVVCRPKMLARSGL
jgi:hypothetical protein